MKNETMVGRITVGGQPSKDELTSGRFGTVINIRGDREEGNTTASDLAGSAMAYTAVPWTIDTVTIDDIKRIRAAVADASGPVLIH